MGDRTYKILIAEDETSLADIYKTKFEMEGHTVYLTPNGDKVVDLALQHTPDIILLDIRMPIVDGFEALKRVRDKQALKDVPVFMLTNLGQQEEIEKGLLMGANDYLVKVHFTLPEILAKIDAYFSGASSSKSPSPEAPSAS